MDPALSAILLSGIVILVSYLYREWKQQRAWEKCPVCGKRRDTAPLRDGTKIIGKHYIYCGHTVRDDGTVVP